MPIYHYRESALLDRIEVRAAKPGQLQATIIARENADATQLEKLHAELIAQDLTVLADQQEGRATLQVRGLQKDSELFEPLNKLGLIKGKIDKETTKEDEKKASYSDRVRGKALFLSALFYDLGNAAFFASGIQRGKHNRNGRMTSNDKSEMMIGAAFSVGDVLMTITGGDKGNEELVAASQGLKRHLHRKGVEIPADLNPDTLHASGAMKSTDRWLRKHMIQIKCLSEFAGGLFTMHAALKPGNHNHGKLAAGFLISTGWLATLLLDKPHGHEIFDGDKAPPSTLLESMKQNPRGLIARPLAMGNNVANLWGALNSHDGERTRFMRDVTDAQKAVQLSNTVENRANLAYASAKQNDYIWNVISACSFLVAHTLFGMSGSKRPTETEDDKTMMNDLVLLSANVLAKQPEATREAAIADTAEYVSKLSHITMRKEDLADAIRSKIDGLSQSSWAARVQPAAQTQVTQRT